MGSVLGAGSNSPNLPFWGCRKKHSPVQLGFPFLTSSPPTPTLLECGRVWVGRSPRAGWFPSPEDLVS